MKRTLPLTEKQEKLWSFIRSCERSPSFAEMAQYLGTTSKGEVHRLLVGLKRRGFVDFEPVIARSVVALHPRNDLADYPTEALRAELERRAIA